MKALTLTQPWASLVAIGAKRVETRSWSTSYRGPLLIHAAKGMSVGDLAFAHELRRRGVLPPATVEIAGSHYRGVLVARCRLVDVVPTFALVDGPRTNLTQHVISPLERELGDYSHGRFAWLLEDVEPIDPPIPARGALGLWTWSNEP